MLLCVQKRQVLLTCTVAVDSGDVFALLADVVGVAVLAAIAGIAVACREYLIAANDIL